MGWACGWNGRDKNCIQNSGKRTREKKHTLGILKRIWDYNFKIFLGRLDVRTGG
jgi:hypothetical protein